MPKQYEFYGQIDLVCDFSYCWVYIDNYINIYNSIDTFKSKYYGIDRAHANEEGMQLIVDFLLKQPSIQKVLK